MWWMQLETKFLRLRKAVAIGECIGGWRVCWLGGWDKGRVFYVAMGVKTQVAPLGPVGRSKKQPGPGAQGRS